MNWDLDAKLQIWKLDVIVLLKYVKFVYWLQLIFADMN